MARDSSPFHQMDLQPIGDIYTKEGSLFGIRTMDGQVFLNFNASTNYGRLQEVARLLKAEVVTVKGTWTFLPHRETPLNEEDEVEELSNGQT